MASRGSIALTKRTVATQPRSITARTPTHSQQTRKGNGPRKASGRAAGWRTEKTSLVDLRRGQRVTESTFFPDAGMSVLQPEAARFKVGQVVDGRFNAHKYGAAKTSWYRGCVNAVTFGTDSTMKPPCGCWVYDVCYEDGDVDYGLPERYVRESRLKECTALVLVASASEEEAQEEGSITVEFQETSVVPAPSDPGMATGSARTYSEDEISVRADHHARSHAMPDSLYPCLALRTTAYCSRANHA
jgi:hypothetical protein